MVSCLPVNGAVAAWATPGWLGLWARPEPVLVPGSLVSSVSSVSLAALGSWVAPP